MADVKILRRYKTPGSSKRFGNMIVFVPDTPTKSVSRVVSEIQNPTQQATQQDIILQTLQNKSTAKEVAASSFNTLTLPKQSVNEVVQGIINPKTEQPNIIEESLNNNVVERERKKLQINKPGEIFKNPFFSREGQKERFRNVINVFDVISDPTDTFENNFFSREGQKERLKNLGYSEALAASKVIRFNTLGFVDPIKGKFNANTQNKRTNKLLELGANNPGEAAAGLAAAYTLIAGAATATTAAAAASKSATGLGKLGAGYKGARGALAAKQLAYTPRILQGTSLAARGGKFGLGLGAGVLGGKGIVKGFFTASDVTDVYNYGNLTQEKINNIPGVASALESNALKGEAGINIPFTDKGLNWKSLVYEINPQFSLRKDVYKQSIKDQLKAEGFKGKELDNAYNAFMRRREAGELGEAASLLYLNTLSEIYGESAVKTSFQKSIEKGTAQFTGKQSFTKLFGKAFIPIGSAGFIEGFSGELAQQEARGKKTDLKQAGVMGGYGFLSAGLIGGTIVGTSVNRPTASKILQVGAYATDPYELPGDLLAKGLQSGSSKITGLPFKVPIITSVNTDTFSLAIGQEGGAKGKSNILNFAQGRGKKNTNILGFNNILTNPQTTTNIKTQTKVPTPANIDIFKETNFNFPIDNNIPIDSETQINPNPFTQTDTNTNPFTQTDTNINTNVNTNTPVNIFSNVPVVTPQIRIPPPLPLAFPSGSGGAGARIGKGTKFINELEIGRQVLFDFSGAGTIFNQPKKTTKRRTTKRRTTKRQTIKNPFDIKIPGFTI